MRVMMGCGESGQAISFTIPTPGGILFADSFRAQKRLQVRSDSRGGGRAPWSNGRYAQHTIQQLGCFREKARASSQQRRPVLEVACCWIAKRRLRRATASCVGNLQFQLYEYLPRGSTTFARRLATQSRPTKRLDRTAPSPHRGEGGK